MFSFNCCFIFCTRIFYLEKAKMILEHGWEHIIKPELKKTGENIKNEIKKDAIEKSKRFCLQDLEEDKSKARCLAILKILNII